ncbi:MAG: DUF805 domain-containing protein [Phyllobacteriaceae bacterium]|nr:DUF805 domain-containing protein [Phyllobacteriaceae bacterium]
MVRPISRRKEFVVQLSVLLPFEGRIGRPEWWGCVLAALALCVPFVVGVSSVRTGYDILHLVAPSIKTGSNLVLLAIAQWILFVGAAKRLRDRGKSVEWLTMLFVPFLGAAWLFFELGFLPSASESAGTGALPSISS